MAGSKGITCMTERAVCPHCGEKRGYKHGTEGGSQRYRCAACRRYWRGEIAPPPERSCPYCHGHCRKAGKKFATGVRPGRLSALQRWFGDTQLRPPETVQQYRCTICGKYNRELWPAPYRPGKSWGTCRYKTAFFLDSAAEEALFAYCRKHKLQRCEAIRTIFREASYTRFGARHLPPNRPPELPPDTPMPPLPDGRPAVSQRKRGKLFGHQEVIIVLKITVGLDPVSYRGLLRTMQAKNMTRQEAARCLILSTAPKFIGQAVKRSDWGSE